MLRDLLYAARYLWTQKAFTAAAVLTLAIGLGANTALYGVLNSTLRPLALPSADRLVAIAAEPEGDETGGFQFTFSIEQMKDFQTQAEPFSDVVGLFPCTGGLASGALQRDGVLRPTALPSVRNEHADRCALS